MAGWRGGLGVASLAGYCLAVCQPLFVSQANISKTHGGQESPVIHHGVAPQFVFSARYVTPASLKRQSYKVFSTFF